MQHSKVTKMTDNWNKGKKKKKEKTHLDREKADTNKHPTEKKYHQMHLPNFSPSTTRAILGQTGGF